MKKHLLAVLFLLVFGSSPSWAGCATLPFTLLNSATADAAQTMADLNALNNGCLAPVANNTALSALATTPNTVVVRTGYAAAGDAPLLAYLSSGTACSLNAGAGDGGSQVTASGGGCWNAVFPAEGLDVREFGAVGDNSTNDTTALQNAINAAAGRPVLLQSGKTYSHAGLTIGNGSATAASTLLGAVLTGIPGGAMPNATFGFTGGTRQPTLSYTGAGVGLAINGPIQGWGLQGIHLHCTNTAATALSVISAQNGVNSSLQIDNCKAALNSTTVTAIPAGLTNADSLHNSYRDVQITLPNVAGVTGIFIGSAGAGVAANTDYNDFQNIEIWNQGAGAGTGIYFAASDSNHFSNVHFFGAGGSYKTVIFDYTVNSSWPASNTLDHFDTAAGVGGQFVNVGSPGASATPNWVNNLVLTNGASYPLAVANLLVDHAQAAWTPTMAGTGVAGTFTYTNQIGSIEENGATVHLQFKVGSSGWVNATGNLSIAGVPVAAANVPGDEGVCSISQAVGWTATGARTWLAANMAPNTATIGPLENGSALAVIGAPVGDFASGAQVTIEGTCIYHRS